MKSDSRLIKIIVATILMTAVYMLLKLCNIVDFSWLWVFSPIWITFILIVVIYCIYFIWILTH